MEHTEIYTLGQCSPYPKESSERRLRRKTIDLRPDMDKAKERSWIKLVRKNKPQQKSIIGGLILFLGTSIHIIWGHWRLDVLSSWKSKPNLVTLVFTMCTWYLGSMCGTILCAILIKVWTKKQIYYLSGSILSLSGVLFIIWHDTLPALVTGRVLAGVCNGFVFLTLLVHAAENTTKELRGFVLSSIGYLMTFSTFFSTLLFIIPYYHPSPIRDPNNATGVIHVSFDVDLLLGIVTFVYAIIALLTIPYLTYESVPFLIQQGRERKALENLIKLRNETTVTWAIRNEFDELRLMVVEDYRTLGKCNGNIFTDGNIRPLLLVTGVRVMVLLASSLPFQLISTMFTKLMLYNSENGVQYSMMILLGSRVGLGILPVLLSDKWGRKCFLFTSGMLCGICLVILGIALIIDDFNSESFELEEWVPGILFILFYMFASIGIDNIGNVLTAEAFPLAKKAWSIAFAMVVEHAIQCLFLVWVISVRLDYDNIIAMILLTGFGIIALTVWLHFALPETRGMSLRQCREEFNHAKASASFNGNPKMGGGIESGITYS